MADQPSPFTKNFKRLEEIAAAFEKEEVDLEKGLTLYKEAAQLVQKLKERLKAIENEIKEVHDSLGEET